MSNYDKAPFIPVSVSAEDCKVGWVAIADHLQAFTREGAPIICIECYPGVFINDLSDNLFRGLATESCVDLRACLKTPYQIAHMLAPNLTDDPVFGRMNGIGIADFLDAVKVAAAKRQIASRTGPTLVIGTGATLVAPEADLVVYADLSRWEIQQRQRRNEVGNLGVDNRSASPTLKYKQAFFVDWRAADRLKKTLLPQVDFLLDTNDRATPKLITGEAFRNGMRVAVTRPFRVVPFFDPGPWGGQWMKRVFDLPQNTPNYAWGFDCVPEENSLLFGFGCHRVEVPAIDLVFMHPRELLGEAVHARFGTEFPIRFDLLDTMGGGNLSLQVHPLTEYIQDQFGMHYTQDESYYLLDATEDAVVYLGAKTDVDPSAMIADLRRAQSGNAEFPEEKYVNQWRARKHDHFLIPAGTIHCSGQNSMVLEISATPYIFTFKLWDWGRLGLNGMPRPIHIDHGIANVQWDRTTGWVQRNLIERCSLIARGEGWQEERTGLHEREFIETRRHWFTAPVTHNTGGGVNVLNLVEGDEIVVESPTDCFPDFVVHYAETFIVPAAVGTYRIRPTGSPIHKQYVTVKAFVR